jgi:hypothetical protein
MFMSSKPISSRDNSRAAIASSFAKANILGAYGLEILYYR